jgi:RHS repeat-associated protein
VHRTWDRKDRTYGPGGVLKNTDGIEYRHDLDGRLIEKVMPNGERWRYTWDYADQVVEVVRPDGKAVTFAYDALHRRVSKTMDGRTTRYVWDGDVIVHEQIEDKPLVTWEFDLEAFAPLAKIEGERKYSVMSDHLGTAMALVDEAGKLAWNAQLDLYGVPLTNMTTTCRWRWPGQYEDEETGLFYNRFRYYSPESGGYISQDPIALLGGLRAYGYVLDPLTWLDPSGLSGFNPIKLGDHDLWEKIHEFLYRNKRVDGAGGGTHGLIHRIREQILGGSRPASLGWAAHESAILRQQDCLRRSLLEWQARGFNPPKTAWQLATMRPPTGRQIRVPKKCR